MRRLLILSVVLGGSAAPALAQDTLELGAHFGATVSTPDDGDTEVFAGIPGGGVGSLSSVYASIRVYPQILVEPQIGVQYASPGDRVAVSLMGQLVFPFRGGTGSYPYLALHSGALVRSGGLSDSGAVGGGFGYRARAGSVLSLRLETRFRRWLGSAFEQSDLSFLAGVGFTL